MLQKRLANFVLFASIIAPFRYTETRDRFKNTPQSVTEIFDPDNPTTVTNETSSVTSESELAASITPEIGHVITTDAPQTSNAAGTDTPEQSDAAGTDTPEQSNAAGTDTPEQSDAAGTDTQEQSNAAGTDTPEQSNAVGTDTPEQSNAAGTDTPEQSNAVGTDTPEQSNAVGTDTPEQSNAVGTDTPEQSNAAGTDTPEQSNAAGTDTPEQSNAAGTDTPEQSNTAGQPNGASTEPSHSTRTDSTEPSLESETDAIQQSNASGVQTTTTSVMVDVINCTPLKSIANNKTKTSESQMKRLIFIGTDRDLELLNSLNAEEIVDMSFSESIQQCTYVCKGVIGNDHFNNHVNRYDTHSGKCTCYLFNRCQQQFQSTLHDFSWSPKQTSYHYSVHRNVFLLN